MANTLDTTSDFVYANVTILEGGHSLVSYTIAGNYFYDVNGDGFTELYYKNLEEINSELYWCSQGTGGLTSICQILETLE